MFRRSFPLTYGGFGKRNIINFRRESLFSGCWTNRIVRPNHTSYSVQTGIETSGCFDELDPDLSDAYSPLFVGFCGCFSSNLRYARHEFEAGPVTYTGEDIDWCDLCDADETYCTCWDDEDEWDEDDDDDDDWEYEGDFPEDDDDDWDDDDEDDEDEWDD